MSKKLSRLAQSVSINGQGFTDFLTGDTVIESAVAEVNIDGTGRLSLSWKSTHGGAIAVGSTIEMGGHTYYADKSYAPTANGDGMYTWSPSFISTDALFSKILFSAQVQTVGSGGSAGGEIDLFTFSFVGKAEDIVSKLSECLDNEDSDGSVAIAEEYADVGITVAFDGDSVKSAAQKVANALGTNLTIVGGELRIGYVNAYAADEYFNYFIVLGGTKNMGKKTLADSQYYAAVTQRLRLPDEYDRSAIDMSSGSQKMMKILIFDDIYPKLELTIGQVLTRECYLLDDEGEHIKYTDGQGVERSKTYTKYYISLMLGDSAYTLDSDDIIAGKPLGILFQSGVLTGREFDLAYFDPDEEPYGGYTEHEEDDVNPQPFQVPAGYYRIIMHADGDTLLPNTALPPAVGDKVTLTGVALSEEYIEEAQARLLEAGEAAAAMYSSGAAPEFEAATAWNDFLTGEDTGEGPSAADAQVGEESDGYVCTAVIDDLIAGTRKATFGTFRPKGLIESMVDKVEGASLAGGGGTTGSDDDGYTRNTATMGIDQWKALKEAGGNLGMISVNQKINNNAEGLDSLRSQFEDVQEQADRAFDIWFLNYTPSPLAANPSATPNFPSSEWNTAELKELHLQDIAYNVQRLPGTTGGRMWRWVREEDNNSYIYYWEEITDGDTLAALEKIADVASDGVLTAGAEKSRVRIEWESALSEYNRYGEQAEDYGLKSYTENGQTVGTDSQAWLNYKAAFMVIVRMLNNESDPSDTTIDMTTFAYLAILGGVAYPAWLANLTTNSVIICGAENYRAYWYEYYRRLDELVKAITIKAKALADKAQETADEAQTKLDDMASDGKLEKVEKLDVKREFIALWQEMLGSTGILDKATTIENGVLLYLIDDAQYIDPYTDAFAAIGTYLNGGTSWTIPQLAAFNERNAAWSPSALQDSQLPAWIREDEVVGKITTEHISETNTINAATWRGLWSTFYEKRSTVYTALTESARGIAETAVAALAALADDDVLTTGEKIAVRREWERVVQESRDLVATAIASGLSNSRSGGNDTTLRAYLWAAWKLWNYLDSCSGNDDLISEQVSDGYDLTVASDPDMLYEDEVSTITGSTFLSLWETYYTAATTLRQVLYTRGVKTFVSTTLPTPPYKAGDIWIKTSSGNNGYKTYKCTTSRNEGATPQSSDWSEIEVPSAPGDPRGLLIELANVLYRGFKSDLQTNFPITISLSDTSAGNTATTYGGTTIVDNTVNAKMKLLQIYLGNRTFDVLHNSQTPSSAPTGNDHNVWCRPVGASIPGTNDTVEGGIQIWWFNDDNEWELLQENVNSLLENLGTAINALIFGSAAAANEVSGLSIGQKFAKLFAAAQVYDPNNPQADPQTGYVTLTQALFGLSITTDSDGRYVSVGSLSADKINFKTGNFQIQNQNNVVTFSIDANGNISVCGEIRALALLIENSAMIKNLVAGGVISRSGGTNGGTYTKINGGLLEIGTYTIQDGDYVDTPTYTVGSDSNSKPVIQLHGSNGTVLGKIDGNLFVGQAVADSWNIEPYVSCGGSDDLSDLEEGDTVNLYQFIVGDPNSQQASEDQRWFTAPSLGSYATGMYAEGETRYRFRVAYQIPGYDSNDHREMRQGYRNVYIFDSVGEPSFDREEYGAWEPTGRILS